MLLPALTVDAFGMPEAQNTSTTMSRCPACGQRLDGSVSAACPLCGYHLTDDRATGVDVTPYARCFAKGERGWWRMCVWIWLAGQGRLKHLAMMRGSAASRRFAWLNLFLLATVTALFQATQQGWWWVSRASTARDPVRQPSGGGWLHVSSLSPNKIPGLAPDAPVDLWWNPIQSLVAVVGGFGAAIVLVLLSYALLSKTLRSAHKASYREEQRMSAALHYSTAWVVFVAIGVMLSWLRPLSYVGAMADWIWYPPLHFLNLLAAIVVAVGVSLWCFWMVRIAWTSPVSTRARVASFTVLGVPVIIAFTAAAWWNGQDMAYPWMFKYLKIAF